MKKTVILITLSVILIACNSGKKQTIGEIIATKDLAKINAKKLELHELINQLDEAMDSLNKNNEIEFLISAVPVEQNTFSHYLEVQGNINTYENILIQPEMSGKLETLTVKAGQKVSKGQLLGNIEFGAMAQQLASAENQYELSKTTFDRQKNLWEQKIGSEIQYLQTQTQMRSAKENVEQIKSNMTKAEIRAPFTGTIDEVFVEKGEIVSPNQKGLMRIVNLQNMYVSTSIPETYIGKLKIGTEVDVFLSSLNKSYKGKVRQIGNFINPNNRSFGIEVSVPNPENLLRPNQVAKLKVIDYVNPKAIIVPTNVILEDSKRDKYVYVVADSDGKSGRAKKVFVKIGKSSDNNTEVLSGLTTKDLIVTDGSNTISEGMKLVF